MSLDKRFLDTKSQHPLFLLFSQSQILKLMTVFSANFSRLIYKRDGTLTAQQSLKSLPTLSR
jgi:hypothetical protein